MPIESEASFDTVMKDVAAILGDSFSPRHAEDDDEPAFRVSKHFKGAEVISNDQVAAVPWTYLCKHTGDFQCLFPTGRDVTIEGLTLVDSREGETVLHRYIDWMGLASQLGLEVSWRVAVTEAEYTAASESS
jgi:hypothetical protein